MSAKAIAPGPNTSPVLVTACRFHLAHGNSAQYLEYPNRVRPEKVGGDANHVHKRSSPEHVHQADSSCGPVDRCWNVECYGIVPYWVRPDDYFWYGSDRKW